MAKIYSPPQEVPVPTFSFRDIKGSKEKENKFIEDLKEWAKKRRPNQENIGEVIQFPVADGYAMYMVAGLKPVELIHLPLGDAWEFQYAHKLNKKDVEEKVSSNKRIAEMFAKRKEEKGV